MPNLIQNTGIVGSPLPNIYFDRILIKNNAVELDVSYYKLNQRQFPNNSINNIYFRLIQIQNQDIYDTIKQLTNLDLIISLDNLSSKEYEVKYIDLPISSFNRTILPQLFISYQDVLVKNKTTLTFNIQPEKNDFLAYIALPYIYDKNLNTLQKINIPSPYWKRENEEVLINKNLKRSRINYYIRNTSTPWFGPINQTSRDLIRTIEQNPRFVEQKIEENTKIIYISQQNSDNAPSRNPPARRSSSSRMSSFAAIPPETATQRLPTPSFSLEAALTPPARSLPTSPPPPQNPFNLRNSREVYEQYINQKPVFDPQNIFSSNDFLNNSITINFSVDFDKLITDYFLNKNAIKNNSEMMSFLKDSIKEKSVILIKKFIPNKNTFLSDINFNQPEEICTDLYIKTLQTDTNNVYSFSMTHTTKNSDKYDYYVKILFENTINRLLFEQIDILRQDRKELQNYYSLFVNYKNSIYSMSEVNEKFEQLRNSGISQRYITCYNRIFNISPTSPDYINVASVFNLLSPAIAGNNSNGVLQYMNLHDQLIKRYEDLYESLKPPKLINSSTFKSSSPNLTQNVSFDLLNSKTHLFEQKKKIKQNNILARKKSIEINYLSSISNNSLTIEQFVDRIKQEKGRLFGTSRNIAFSDEYMFTYLSPDAVKILNYDNTIVQQFFLSDVNVPNIEDTLNNLISAGNLYNINNNSNNINSQIYKKDNYENERLKTITSKNYESYFSKKFGLTVAVDSGNKQIVEDKIIKINKIIEFNNLYNINIPNNITNLPNHLIKAREEASDLNTYLSVFNYRILMKIVFAASTSNGMMMSDLTKSSLINMINDSQVSQIRCRLVPHDYSYNTNLKYDISNISSFQSSEFVINIDRNISSQFIIELINSV